MNDKKDVYKYVTYSNLVNHFFRTCKELDKEFFGKEWLAKAANKTIGPLHTRNIGIDKAIDEIFSLNHFITALRPILRKSLMKK